MSDKYYGKSTASGATVKDFAVQLASTMGTKAEWCDYFQGESYNQAGTNTTNLTMNDYYVDGNRIQGVKIGCLPTKQYKFAEFTTSNDYYFVRTDAGITFTLSNGSTVATITKDQFRDGVTPHEVLVVLCGGGGGGGGCGSYCNDKDDFTLKSGGAGGGGGVAATRLKLTTNQKYRVTVGPGGSVGSNNTTSEGSDSTTGTAGSNGGFSNLVQDGQSNALLLCYGGRGGTAGGASGIGVGGNGGTVLDTSRVNSNYVSQTGGRGNHYNYHNNSGIAALTFTPTTGTGVGALTMNNAKNNNGNSDNKSTDNGSGYFSGGCSMGYGAYPNSAKTGYYSASQGGGGMSGTIWKTAGATGCAQFYY